MDTGKGNFDMMDEGAAERIKRLFPRVADRIFKVGEMVHIKDSFFRIKSIKPDELRLKLLSNEQSAAARKAEKDTAAHGQALDFVNRAEVAEEQSFLKMLASKDKRAASEMLIALRESYQGRLARIDMKLEELAVDLLGDDFRPINEAVDAMIAEQEDPELDEDRYIREAAEDDWPDFEDPDDEDMRSIRKLERVSQCLRHDFSEDRQVCRVCGITIEAFRAGEAAAEEALMRMRNELLGKEEP